MLNVFEPVGDWTNSLFGWLLLFILGVWAGPVFAATISGTVTNNAGTPALLALVPVVAYTAVDPLVTVDPCNPATYQIAGTTVTDGSGVYMITHTLSSTSLPAGDYYLRAIPAPPDNYIAEWWALAGSTSVCGSAELVTVAVGGAATGKDFQLDVGATISGTARDNLGALLTSGYVDAYAYTGPPLPCAPMTYTFAGTATIGADGTYTIIGLPAGTYYLKAFSDNHISGWRAAAGSSSDCALAETVSVLAGATVIGKDFQLDIGSKIFGIVRDSAGVPLVDDLGYVEAYTDACLYSYAGHAFINSNGTYEITGLPLGTYYLKAYPSGNYVSGWRINSTTSTLDCNSASFVSVTVPGQVISPTDFQLDSGAQTSGVVTDNYGTPVVWASVDAYDGDPCGATSAVPKGTFTTDVNGAYKVIGLPDGTYYLKASVDVTHIPEWWADPSSTAACEGAQGVIVIAGGTVAGKNFQLDVAANISGIVTGGAGTDGGYVDAYSGSACSGTWVASGSLDTSGAYMIEGIPAGTYYLKASANGNFIPEWWAGSASTPACGSAGTVTVTVGGTASGKNFQLGAGATISGTVYDTSPTPVAISNGGYVMAIAGTPCGSYTVFRVGDIGTDGTYTVTGLPAGSYYLKAYPLGLFASEWWANPASTPDCSVAGLVVTGTSGNNFQLDTGFLVTASASPVAGGTVSGSGTYASGGTATVTAAPAAGYHFTGWTGDVLIPGDTTNPLSITVDAPKTVAANFARNSYTVTTSSATLPSGSGGTVSPGGTYNSGSTATLTASPASGYVFTGWSGDTTGSTNPLGIPVYSNRNIVANFAKTYTVTISALPAAGGTFTGNGIYAYGSTAILTATPARGYLFTGWSGDVLPADLKKNPLGITVYADKNITANFVKRHMAIPIRTIDGTTVIIFM